MEDRDDIIVLRDDEGNEEEYEIIQTISMGDKDYVVMLPMAVEEPDSVTIMQVKSMKDGTSTYLPIRSKAEMYAVFDIYRELVMEELDEEE